MLLKSTIFIVLLIESQQSSTPAKNTRCAPVFRRAFRQVYKEVSTTSPLHFQKGDDPQFFEVIVNWVILVVAGLFEMGWAIGLKYTDGFTRIWPTIGTVCAMIISLALLGFALKSLPVGTAHAVWVGIGAIGTAILGFELFHEPVTMVRLLSQALIFAGIVGLKYTSPQ
jgi:quaternary ammonium compound-resistance protein SugE